VLQDHGGILAGVGVWGRVSRQSRANELTAFRLCRILRSSEASISSGNGSTNSCRCGRSGVHSGAAP
jgi:hypothetical protein